MTFGQLLDRAITLLVKNFAPLLLIIAIVEVPIAIIGYLTLPPSTDYLRALGQLIAHPGPLTWRGLLFPTHNAPLGGGVATLMHFATFALTPLGSAAVIAAVAALNAGDSVKPATAYERAIKRWLPIVIVEIIFFLLLFVCTMAFIIIAAIAGAVIGGAFAVMHAQTAGIVAGILVLIVIGLLAIPPLAWVTLASYFSYVDLITGESNPIAAIGRSFRRVFARGFRVRSLIESLAVGAVSVGSWIMSLLIGELLFGVGQQSFVIDVATTIISLITTLVIFGFVTIVYFDTLARLAPPEPAPVTV